MARIDAIPREDLPDYEPMFQLVEGAMGFLPSSMRTMARIPALLEAFSNLAATVTMLGTIDPGLSQMIANVTSQAAGCRYCQAHTATHAAHAGVDATKIEKLWEFEASDLFSPAERAALRVARGAGTSPNTVTDDEFADLRQHFTDEQVVQIVATISLFGYLNRWNDTMATTLESVPLAFGHDHLADAGWHAGKHAGKHAE